MQEKIQKDPESDQIFMYKYIIETISEFQL